MEPLTGDEVLRLPVLVRGIAVGRPVDLILHPSEPRALGLVVLCGDERHRFLPLAVASVTEDALEVGSPLVLLDVPPRSFYRTEGRALSELRGARVAGDGRTLSDVVLGGEWTIQELVLDSGGSRTRIPLDGNELPSRRRVRRRTAR
jgi:hypothetical protein